MRRLTLILAGFLVFSSVANGQTATDTPSEKTEPGITLKWSARNEKLVYGYLIYRAERRQGPFLRINPEIIHVETPATGESISSHEYTDASVTPSSTYFYYLDTISNGGVKTRFSGVIKKSAPPQPAAETPDAE